MLDKTLSTIPILTGTENNREWSLSMKGAAMWNSYWLHYIEENTMAGETSPDDVKVTLPPTTSVSAIIFNF